MQGPLGNLPVGPDSKRTVTVLAVSSHVEDHNQLLAIFGHSNWRIFSASGLGEAIESVRRNRPAVLISEGVLPDGDWKNLLRCLSAMPSPPLLVVTAHDPPDSLWAEVLNLGAYDVLSKPFDRNEVTRIVSLAWLHWREQTAQPPNDRLAC